MAELIQPRRLAWIDWMKVIGIFLIVYGHLFSTGHLYVYTFSVPLFFVISGFLCKREAEQKVFWRKLWWNLIVPLLLIRLICFVLDTSYAVWRDTFEVESIFSYWGNLLLGIHEGLITMWFVYTLIVLKIILQYAPKGRFAQGLLFVILPLTGMWLNEAQPVVAGRDIMASNNAIIASTMAYPFFIIGFHLKRWKQWLDEKRAWTISGAALLLSLVIVIVCTQLNGGVWMYMNGYGQNIFLFLIGGMAGTAMIFVVSKRISVILPPRLLIYPKERFSSLASTSISSTLWCAASSPKQACGTYSCRSSSSPCLYR